MNRHQETRNVYYISHRIKPGQDVILIIEAKAADGLDADQNTVFAKDTAEVKRFTEVETVRLMGLCSSKHILHPSAMAARHWGQ